MSTKNKVNNTNNKKYIIYATILGIFVLCVGISVFYTIHSRNNDNITGESKNLTTAVFESLEISSSTKILNDKKTISKNKYIDLSYGNTYYLLDMGNKETIRIKTNYLKPILQGKTKNNKKYYYQVQIVAYNAKNKIIADTGKVNVKSSPMLQTLSVNNSIDYIQIFVYNANSSRKVVETRRHIVKNRTTTVSSNEVIADPVLRKCALESYNSQYKTSNKTLTVSDLRKITKLDCNNLDITNTKGIEEMTSLQTLSLSGENIKSINLTKNTKLTKLYINNTEISKIDLTKNTKLKELYLVESSLKSINLTKNTELTLLSLSRNNLTSINLTKNTKLKRLDLNFNNIKSLNLTKNTKITWLELDDNSISSINLSKNINLETLFIRGNKLVNLDLSKNKKLKEVYSTLSKNKIDVGNNKTVKLYD